MTGNDKILYNLVSRKTIALYTEIITNLGVVNLKIGREIHFGGLNQLHITHTRNSHTQSNSLVSLQLGGADA